MMCCQMPNPSCAHAETDSASHCSTNKIAEASTAQFSKYCPLTLLYQALKVSAIFFSLSADLLHCLSVAAVMKRYARSPCTATNRSKWQKASLLTSTPHVSYTCKNALQIFKLDPHLCSHSCDAVRGIGAARSIGLVQVILRVEPSNQFPCVVYLQVCVSRSECDPAK